MALISHRRKGEIGKKEKMAKKSQEAETRGSLRSQASLIKEHRLKQQSETQQRMIGYAEKGIAELESECSDLAHSCAVQGPVWRSRLNDRLTKLDGDKRVLAAHKKHLKALESQIAELQPTSAQREERTKNQSRFASLVRARLATDNLLAEAVDRLFSLLQQRQDLTLQMLECARLIDLRVGEDKLDSGRFDELASALPSALLKQSREWVARFLGEPRETATYTAIEETTLVETLANANFFILGQSMQLTAAEAAEVFPKKAEAQEFREWQKSGAAKAPPGAGPVTEVDRWYAENAPRTH